MAISGRRDKRSATSDLSGIVGKQSVSNSNISLGQNLSPNSGGSVNKISKKKKSNLKFGKAKGIRGDQSQKMSIKERQDKYLESISA